MSEASEVGTGRRTWLVRVIADRRVITKIGLAVLVVAFIGAGVGLLSVARMSGVSNSTANVYQNTLELQDLAKMRNSFNRARFAALEHFLTIDPATKAAQAKAFDTEVANVNAAEAAYKQVGTEDDEAARLAEFDRAWASYTALVKDKLLPLSDATKFDQIEKLRQSDEKPLLASLRGAMDGLVALNDSDSVRAKAAAEDTYTSSRNLVVALIIIGLLVGVGLSIGIARLITRPLESCVATLNRIHKGDLTARTGVTGRDEVGQLALALDDSTEATASMVRNVTENAQQLASAAEELSSVSNQMSTSAEDTSGQAGSVSAAAEQVSSNVHTVAAGAEEMGSSIREIASNAGEAARVSAAAAETANRTNELVTRLGQSSAEITTVVRLITSIAEQTNLLALNATIEAARAGIQDETEQAVAAISEITSVTGSINDFTSTIAAAVEEQTATTSEIARNVSQAAQGANEIARSITGVAQAAGDTATGATQTQGTARELARMAGELQATISAYRV